MTASVPGTATAKGNRSFNSDSRIWSALAILEEGHCDAPFCLANTSRGARFGRPAKTPPVCTDVSTSEDGQPSPEDHASRRSDDGPPRQFVPVPNTVPTRQRLACRRIIPLTGSFPVSRCPVLPAPRKDREQPQQAPTRWYLLLKHVSQVRPVADPLSSRPAWRISLWRTSRPQQIPGIRRRK